jgi:hypothetical protein
VSDIKPLRPTLGDPEVVYEPDEEGQPIPCTPTVGWDISFGCRLNFGWDPDGQLAITVSISDEVQKNGIAKRKITSKQLNDLSGKLVEVARAGLSPLQAHLASEHALANAYTLNYEERQDYHRYEHGRTEDCGGGTIRNHPYDDQSFDIERAVAVIREGLEQ